MSNKRVKRVHISGWLEVFLADTIMARIAHYLSTPTLFQLLLGVNKELRKKATTSKRWNQIMEYRRRMVEDLIIFYEYKDNQNLLAKFIKRLYAKSTCSFCLEMTGARDFLKVRPGSNCRLRSCWECGERRKMFVDTKDFAAKFVLHPDLYAEIPWMGIWKEELDGYCPTVYTRHELVMDHRLWDRRYKKGRKVIRVVDFNGQLRSARTRKDFEQMYPGL